MKTNVTCKTARYVLLKRLVVASCGLLLFLFSTPSYAGERQMLHGNVPAVTKSLARVGRLPASQRLNLAIGLPLRNQEALNLLLQQLYDPASPIYRQFLTPAQFTERFGPTEEDYQAVADFAEASGLTVTHTHPNRVVLEVEGAVPDIEKAFNLKLMTYQHPGEQRAFYAPDVEPSLDLAAPVLQISGLDNYTRREPKMKRRPGSLTASAVPRAGSGPANTYIGSDFRHAYVPGTTLTGAGQSVGLVQFDGYYTNDIKNYIATGGISTAVSLINVPVGGGVSTPGAGNGEVSLDIQMVLSMAPSVAKIYVFEAPNNNTVSWSTILSMMANTNSYWGTNLAKQLSCSWGDNIAGSPDPVSEGIFVQMAVQGQSFFNASGDSDAFSAGIPFPSESTNVTQVGGTTLTTGSGASYTSETVWNWGGGTGSSGGVSTNFRLPAYQEGLSMTANKGSTTMRNVPDVALTADNVYNISDNGATKGAVGGTSCAAPLWAGFMALVNQQAAANGLPTAGFINPAVYAIGKGASYTSCFHDTTTGNNGTSTKYPAVTGYDLCTGWGTPTGTNLIDALAGPPPAPVLTGFSPLSGVALTSVTIAGSNFANVSSVTFNGTAATFTVNSSTNITATVPLTATTGPLQVTTAGGVVTSAASFTVIPGPPAPSITGFSPPYGPVGASITLAGLYFTNVSTVSFNGASAGFMVDSSGQITATVPAGATPGPLSVVTASGTGTSGTNFLVLSGDGSPLVSSFTPTNGWANTSVTITGSNFVAVSAVTFNGASASFTLNSPTQLTATVTAAATTGPITVANAYGAGASSSSFTFIVSPPYAGVLAGWDVNGQTSYGPSPMSPTTNAPNLTVVGLTRGAGLATSGTAASRAWGGNGWTSTSEAGAISASQVATFTLTADANYRVSYSSISKFDYRRSSSGPPNGALQYAVGTGAFTDITALSYASGSSGQSLAAIDLSGIAALQNIGAGTNVTFRIVNWGATSSGGNWYVYDKSNSTADDLEIQGTVTLVTPPPQPVANLAVTATHAGTFTQGDTGHACAISVTNLGNAASSGIVSVTDTLPAGLTATAISGAGWTCTLSNLTCTRSDALAQGAAYPAITVMVNVAATAPASVTNWVTVSGGGETNVLNNSASDTIAIIPLPPVTPFPITSAEFVGPNQFALAWTSISNRTYQVQSSPDLTAGIWTTNATVSATATSTCWTNPAASNSAEFYRVVATP